MGENADPAKKSVGYDRARVRDGKYAGHPLVLRIIRIILYCRIIRKRIMSEDMVQSTVY